MSWLKAEVWSIKTRTTCFPRCFCTIFNTTNLKVCPSSSSIFFLINDKVGWIKRIVGNRRPGSIERFREGRFTFWFLDTASITVFVASFTGPLANSRILWWSVAPYRGWIPPPCWERSPTTNHMRGSTSHSISIRRIVSSTVNTLSICYTSSSF